MRASDLIISTVGFALLSIAAATPASAANPLRASFNAGTDFATGNGPVGVAIADLRGNGNQDIVVANRTDSTVSVLLGAGDGTFAPKQDFPVCSAPFGVAVADLNQDKKPDLVVLCPSSLSVLLGNGDGTFQAHTDYNLQIYAQTSDETINVDKVLVGDLNGDGYPDVMVIANRYCLPCDGGALVLLNMGAAAPGVLQAPTLALGRAMADGVLVDLNGDQKLDLAYADNDTPDGQVGPGWAFGDGTGAFPNDQFTNLVNDCSLTGPPCSNLVNSVAAGDLNGDGKVDLIYSGDNGPCVMLGDGTGGFSACTFQSAFPTVDGLLALSDLSNRGTLDVVSAATGVVQVLIGSGTGSFTQGPTIYNNSSAALGGLAVADLNGDGLPDIVATFNASATVRVWLNVSIPDVAPTASNVSISTLTATPVGGALQGAQSQGGALTYSVVTSPSSGVLQLTGAKGAFTYAPKGQFFGTDTFTYKVNDGYLDSNIATVTVTVHSVPVATSDSLATTAGIAVNGTLKGSDPQGNPLTFKVTGNGGKGTAVITNAATGAFTYTPASGQTGNDSFTFSVSNGFASASATEGVVIGAAPPPSSGGGGGGGLDWLNLGGLLTVLLGGVARRVLLHRGKSRHSTAWAATRPP